MDDGVEGPVGQVVLADVADVERHALRQRILWRDVVEAGDPVPCAWRCRMTWVPMKPEEPVTRTESGLESMPRAASQPALACARQSGQGALKDLHRRAPLKPALQVAFVPVAPPVVVSGQMPHVVDCSAKK